LGVLQDDIATYPHGMISTFNFRILNNQAQFALREKPFTFFQKIGDPGSLILWTASKFKQGAEKREVVVI
jgi:hypothetical protein